MATILVVDDEEVLCDLIQQELATGGRKAIELFAQRRPHLTLLDLRMPEMSGIAVLKRIRALDPQARVIILTGGDSEVWEKQARELGVTEFLCKEVGLKVLVEALGKALQQPARPMGGTGDRQLF